MNYGRKVSLRDAHELVQICLHMGKEAAAAECVSRGISPGYALKETYSRGHPLPKRARGGGNIALSVDHADPRWAWAIERGPVVA
jgi:hypothetical protein